VSRDPLSRLPTVLRLQAAAALCVLPLGLVWPSSARSLTFGTTLPGHCGGGFDFCTPGAPGSYLPGQHILGVQAPARVFLMFAAAVLVLAATRTRTPFTKRLVRAATGTLGIAATLAVAYHAVPTLVCVVAAMALVTPLVWRRPADRPPGVFVPADLRR
jgi:hypothetical protein